tara:strand:+ start:849 stop:1085 length:237 start_codon:yes stop_codon:yes gene_type:complete
MASGKVIKFPTLFEGNRIDTSKTRMNALKKRMGILEQRLSNYSDDIAYISACAEEDEYELGEIINELKIIMGFEEEDL